jgi:hypothetical protein
MASGIIPQIGTKGRWVLKNPFSTTPGLLYTLGATRFFVDIENQGVNVYETFYATASPAIPQADYQRDRNDGVVLLTLLSDTEAPRYVPSSYVVQYPAVESVPYQHLVISASIGALPVAMDLQFLQDQVSKIISDTIGVTPVINIGAVPLLTVMTPAQHNLAEALREGKINNRTTDYALLVEERRQKTLLAQRLAIAEKIIKDNGLIP